MSATEHLAKAHKLLNGRKSISVRLDRRTIITVANERAIEFWRQRYPDLQVMDTPTSSRSAEGDRAEQ